MDFVALLASLLWPFILCYFSTFTTNRLTSLGFIAYDSNWHEYPPKLRNHMILIIKRSQKPALFSGFRIIHSTLDTFAQVSGNISHSHLEFSPNLSFVLYFTAV